MTSLVGERNVLSNIKFNKQKFLANVYFFIFAILLFFDALNGALRYYFDILAIGPLIYFPKILMIASIPFLIFINRIGKKTFFFALFLLWSSFYSILNNSFSQIVFGIYMISPLLFGMLYANNFNDLQRINKVLAVIFWITVIGVFLNFLYRVPWEGYEQIIAGKVIEANRQWTTFGIKRIAGFGRLSASTAVIIGISSLVYLNLIKNNFAKIFIILVSLIAIILTTNKSSAVAYLLSVLFLNKSFRTYFGGLSIFSAVVLGMGLPLYSTFIGFPINTNNFIEKFFLASFNDRLQDTWPNVLNALANFADRYNKLIYFLGKGVGGFGSPVKYFSNNNIFSVSDNSWLYAYGLLGVFGIIFLLYISYVALKYLYSRNIILVSYGVVLNFLLWVGITTDVFFEILTVLCITGYLIGIRYTIKGREPVYV